MNTDVIQRVREFSELNGLNETELASRIGISQRTVNNYMNGSRKVSFEFIGSLIRTFELNANWLITGKGSMQNNDENTTPVFVEEKTKGAIPYYEDLPISAGEAGLAEVSHEEKPTGYLMIPNVTAEQLFPVIGCSMLPRIKPGDIVGVNKLNRWDRVDPDKIYMIVTHEERMLKRLRRDNERDDILWCVSDNYQEFKIYKSEIVSIYHVVYHGQLL